jgi:hypothetical protein
VGARGGSAAAGGPCPARSASCVCDNDIESNKRQMEPDLSRVFKRQAHESVQQLQRRQGAYLGESGTRSFAQIEDGRFLGGASPACCGEASASVASVMMLMAGAILARMRVSVQRCVRQQEAEKQPQNHGPPRHPDTHIAKTRCIAAARDTLMMESRPASDSHHWRCGEATNFTCSSCVRVSIPADRLCAARSCHSAARAQQATLPPPACCPGARRLALGNNNSMCN